MSDTLRSEVEARNHVLLTAGPGCGKTARARKVARDTNRILRVMTCDLMERVDVAGCIVPDVAAGTTRQLPLEFLATLLTTREPQLLLLDEIGRAPIDVQGGVCALIDRIKESNANGRTDVVIIGCSNRVQDRAGSVPLSEQIKTRFDATYEIALPVTDVNGNTTVPRGDGDVSRTYLMQWNCESGMCGACEVCMWNEWAASAEMPAEVVAWQRITNGKELYTWRPSSDTAMRFCDYRTWESVGRAWNQGLRSQQQIAGRIGRSAAIGFLAFARIAQQLPQPGEIALNPATATIPSDPSPLYLLASILAEQITMATADAFVAYMERLPRVYMVLMARDAMRRNSSALASSKQWNRWFQSNQSIFVTSN